MELDLIMRGTTTWDQHHVDNDHLLGRELKCPSLDYNMVVSTIEQTASP